MVLRDGEDASTVLFEAWRSPDLETIRRLLISMPALGDLALRSRFETLVDLHRSPTSTRTSGHALARTSMPIVDRDRWDLQVGLMRAGDAAIQRNEQAFGLEAFEALRESHRVGEHPLPLIEAATGLGDLARQRDDLEESLKSVHARHEPGDPARV